MNSQEHTNTYQVLDLSLQTTEQTMEITTNQPIPIPIAILPTLANSTIKQKQLYLIKILVIWIILQITQLYNSIMAYNDDDLQEYFYNSKTNHIQLISYLIFLLMGIQMYLPRKLNSQTNLGIQLGFLFIFGLSLVLVGICVVSIFQFQPYIYFYIIIGCTTALIQIFVIAVVSQQSNYYRDFLIMEVLFQVVPIIVYTIYQFKITAASFLLTLFILLCGASLVSCSTLSGLIFLHSWEQLMNGKFELKLNQPYIGSIILFVNMFTPC